MKKPTLQRDEDLAAFLKAHAPSVPPSPPELEQRLMAAVRHERAPLGRERGFKLGRWLFPALALGVATAASLLLYLPRSGSPQANDGAAEAFMESSWQDYMIGGDEEADSMSVLLADLELDS